jgi:hypothetical protein
MRAGARQQVGSGAGLLPIDGTEALSPNRFKRAPNALAASPSIMYIYAKDGVLFLGRRTPLIFRGFTVIAPKAAIGYFSAPFLPVPQ